MAALRIRLLCASAQSVRFAQRASSSFQGPCLRGRSWSEQSKSDVSRLNVSKRRHGLVAKYLHTSSVFAAEAVVIKGPAFADSISEGDIKWLKGVGDFVNADEVVAEIETDKTAVEVPCPQSGTIIELLVEDGMKVEAKQDLFKLEPGAASAQTPAAEKSEPASPPPTKEAAPAAPSAGPVPTVAPPAPAMPKQPLASTPPAQPAPRPAAAPTPMPAAVAQKGGDNAITGARAETRTKMNRMRLRIADRLKDAQNTYAMLTTFQEVDMSKIVEIRKKYQDTFQKKHGIKIGFMSPFVRAAAYAMQEQPVINAVIDEQEIIYRHFIDMSVAVASPRGLVVPVIRNVESMNYAQIEREIYQLGVKARDGSLAVEDMEGGTFTISNGGVFGSLFGTPIINPPQSAILGLHAIFDKPVAVQGKVEIHPMMVVALTYDHRLIDGREAVTFLKKIKTSVEDPVNILLDL